MASAVMATAAVINHNNSSMRSIPLESMTSSRRLQTISESGGPLTEVEAIGNPNSQSAVPPRQAKQGSAARRIQRAWRRHTALHNRFTQTEFLQKLQRQAELQRKITEIFIYSLFLVVLTATSVSVNQNQDIYFLGSNMEQLLTQNSISGIQGSPEFGTINSLGDWWEWHNVQLMRGVYGDVSWQNDGPSRFPGKMFGTNWLVGGVRISQLRSMPKLCLTPAFINAPQFQCFGDDASDFSESTEDRRPFGSASEPFTFGGSEAWGSESITAASILAERGRYPLSGERTGLGHTFPAGAFPILLPHANATRAAELIDKAKTNNYTDLATRVLYTDVLVYNPQMDLFSAFVMTSEIRPSGGLQSSYTFQTVRLFNYFDSPLKLYQGLEVVLCLFFLYFTCIEYLKFRRVGKVYFKDFTTWAHNANIFVYVLVWIFRIAAVRTAPDASTIDMTADMFVSLKVPINLKLQATYLSSVNAFLCWFKLVGFLGYIPRFNLITGTLSKAYRGVSGFLLVFVVVFYGFCAAHMIAFGSRMAGYRNLTQSFYSLLSALLGSFDLQGMAQAQWLLGPLFFTIFVALAIFVVLNILIAIISDAYNAQSREVMSSEDVQLYRELTFYVHSKIMFNPVMTFLRRKAPKVTMPLGLSSRSPAASRGSTPALGTKGHKGSHTVKVAPAASRYQVSQESKAGPGEV